ncbi:hypothetical protein MVLG_06999 [Microbotryum lychnidis-dioicae p1A1 Lamole]|uniref:Glycosyl transferase CAP10 domain-containing protein n=1 Tax=Microbotryum lychnidis-dioicae (strain p1A1 Lamole / MvSl-1064) TaxID=683840 RepID=U5HJ05_USTV1|nr:hypothetical protein MVLG_06999 [Microbotryum lychnidis-dioicae p1A1 Lamole]|eukprot:KDE02449.1 hypothetical protein MVLG_06999 [Microbotryum lychnidis-dioicae p1A1 Lamole]
MGPTTPYSTPPEESQNRFEDPIMIPEKFWPGVPATSTTHRSIWKKKRCWAILFFVVAGVTFAVALSARSYEDARKNAKENHRIGMALCDQYPTLPYCLKIKDEVDPYHGTLRYVYVVVSINHTTASLSNDTTAAPSNSTGPSLIHSSSTPSNTGMPSSPSRVIRSSKPLRSTSDVTTRTLPSVSIDGTSRRDNNVQLIDEYDSIYEIISLTPRFRFHDRRDKPQRNPGGPDDERNSRVENLLLLMEGILPMLPDLNLTATGHNSGYIVASTNMKAKHIEAAKAKRYLTEDQLMYFDDYKTLSNGWQSLCPRGSPIRNVSYIADRLAKNERKQITFIEDHKEAMNMCNHSEIQPLHRYTFSSGPRPALLFPLFAFATTTMHNDLLLPSLEQWEVPPGDNPSWVKKTNDKVVWRGTAFNLNLSDKTNREMSQRPRLIEFGDVDGNFKSTHRFSPFMTREEQSVYKYTMDIDGNSWSGPLHTLMSSNSLVLKSTIRPEWYFERIQPWYHYIPVNVDYTDLFNIMAFFKGDIDGNGAYDQLAETMAAQSKEWAAAYWRWEDMQAYLYRLLLEYNRVMQRNPNNYNSHHFTQY